MKPKSSHAVGEGAHEGTHAGKADRTALAVALLDVAAHGRRARAIEYETLRRAGLASAALAWLAASAPGGWLLRRAVDARFGDLAAHVQRRRELVAEQVRRFAACEPHGQVIYLGAGADGAPARLARAHATLQVIALDAAPPASAQAPPANLHVARLDVASSDAAAWARALRAACPATAVARRAATSGAGSTVDAARATLAIAEGLLMYLPRAAIPVLLAHLAAAVAGPLTLLGSYLHRDRLDDPRSGIARVDRYLQRRGHPSFRWAADRSGIASLLRAADLEPIAHLSTGSAYGEELFVARRRCDAAARAD